MIGAEIKNLGMLPKTDFTSDSWRSRVEYVQVLLVKESSIPFIVVIIVGGCGIELTRANAAIWFLSIDLCRADYAVVIWL